MPDYGDAPADRYFRAGRGNPRQLKLFSIGATPESSVCGGFSLWSERIIPEGGTNHLCTLPPDSHRSPTCAKWANLQIWFLAFRQSTDIRRGCTGV